MSEGDSIYMCLRLLSLPALRALNYREMAELLGAKQETQRTFTQTMNFSVKDMKKNLRYYHCKNKFIGKKKNNQKEYLKGEVDQSKRGTGSGMMRYGVFQDRKFTYSSRWTCTDSFD